MFGGAEAFNVQERVPKGFLWDICSVGVDVEGAKDRLVLTSWKFIIHSLNALAQTCVAAKGIGGKFVAGNMVFVITYTSSAHIHGSCLERRPPLGVDLGEFCFTPLIKVAG